MESEAKDHILFVGLGGAGSRLALQAKEKLNSDCLLISHDSKDLNSESSKILINTGSVLNPSSYLIRGLSLGTIDSVSEKISDYSTVVIIANLAGRAGTALAPIVSQAAKDRRKHVISFAIMPFKFEKERIFQAGVSLKRLRANSGCTIVIDNDALLDSNPDLSPNACYQIANNAILEVISSLKSSSIPDDTNILSTSKNVPDVQTSLRDSIKMLYEDAPPNSVKRAMLYVLGGSDLPVGVLNSITSTVRGIFNDDSTAVSMSVTTSDESKVMMLTSVQGETRFDSYDPLGMIPSENTLDWDTPDCSIECELDLVQLE